jgi:hypothetical protein
MNASIVTAMLTLNNINMHAPIKEKDRILFESDVSSGIDGHSYYMFL